MTREEAIKEIKSWDFLDKKETEAIETLIPELRESEDERIRKWLIDYYSRMKWHFDSSPNTKWLYEDEMPCKDILAWLEKQKESLHITEMCKENAGSFTDEDGDRTINGCLLAANAERRCKRASEELLEELGLADYTKFFYEQGVEKGKKEREKQKEQKDYRKLYEDIAKSEWFKKAYVGKSLGEEYGKEEQKPADYNEYKMLIDGAREDGKIKGRKEVIDHPDEYGLTKQKPAEYLSKRKVYDIMNKLTELSTSDLIPIESEEYVRIHEITSDVCSLLDYPIKPVEWNEYDKACINNIVLLLDGNGKYVPDGARQQCLEWFNQHRIAFQNRSVEWSKEDEKKLNHILEIVHIASGREASVDEKEELESFLKSLRPQPKQEWSKEDETMRDRIIDILNRTFSVYSAIGTSSTKPSCPTYKDEIAWLKSLRPQPRWKPSEDEERLINTSISFLKDFAYKGYENAVECIDWLKSKLNGNTCE